MACASKECFGRKNCPGSKGNKTRGTCRYYFPCGEAWIAHQAQKGRLLKNLLDDARAVYPIVSDFVLLRRICKVGQDVGISWGPYEVRTAMKGIEDDESGMRAALITEFRALRAEARGTSLSGGKEAHAAAPVAEADA